MARMKRGRDLRIWGDIRGGTLRRGGECWLVEVVVEVERAGFGWKRAVDVRW